MSLAGISLTPITGAKCALFAARPPSSCRKPVWAAADITDAR